MPDTVSALDAVTRIPNLGLCSIAGNLEGHDVRILDLVFHNRRIRRFLEDVVRDFQPDIVGMSAMSHQYASACLVSEICRRVKADIKTVLGGYHATLMHREIFAGDDAGLFDFIVRGEGEVTFGKLVNCLESSEEDFGDIPGLSCRADDGYRHNPDAPLLDLETLKMPDRSGRILDEARFLGHSFDCVETSRGCTMDCHFCSINRMYGRTMRMFSLDRVIADLKHHIFMQALARLRE